MASAKDHRKVAKLNILCKELEMLTGWKTAAIYNNEDDLLPCGVLIGDETFFDLVNSGAEDDGCQ